MLETGALFQNVASEMQVFHFTYSIFHVSLILNSLPVVRD